MPADKVEVGFFGYKFFVAGVVSIEPGMPLPDLQAGQLSVTVGTGSTVAESCKAALRTSILPVTAAEIDQLTRRINRATGTTIVIITQDVDSVLAIADRAIMLDPKEKTIIAEGDPRELMENPPDARVERFFHRRPRARAQGRQS